MSEWARSQESGPGVWRIVKEWMKPRAAMYQKKITGEIGKAYFVNDVKFDGYNNGTLLEVKGLGYARLLKEGPLKNGQPRKTLSTRDNLVAQMQRQRQVANGMPIVWHVAEPHAVEVMRELLKINGIKGIAIEHTSFLP